MAVDSKTKRLSVIGLAYPGTQTLPVATGSVDDLADRLHLLGYYGTTVINVDIDAPGVLWRLDDDHWTQYRLDDRRVHYSTGGTD